MIMITISVVTGLYFHKIGAAAAGFFLRNDFLNHKLVALAAESFSLNVSMIFDVKLFHFYLRNLG